MTSRYFLLGPNDEPQEIHSEMDWVRATDLNQVVRGKVAYTPLDTERRIWTEFYGVVPADDTSDPPRLWRTSVLCEDHPAINNLNYCRSASREAAQAAHGAAVEAVKLHRATCDGTCPAPFISVAELVAQHKKGRRP